MLKYLKNAGDIWYYSQSSTLTSARCPPGQKGPICTFFTWASSFLYRGPLTCQIHLRSWRTRIISVLSHYGNDCCYSMLHTDSLQQNVDSALTMATLADSAAIYKQREMWPEYLIPRSKRGWRFLVMEGRPPAWWMWKVTKIIAERSVETAGVLAFEVLITIMCHILLRYMKTIVSCHCYTKY